MNGVSLQQLGAEHKKSNDFNFQFPNLDNRNSEIDSKLFLEFTLKRTVNDLTKQVAELENLVSELTSKLNNNPRQALEQLFFTRLEVSKMLKVSLPTLNTWEKTNILKPDRMGTRVRYTLESIKKAFVQSKN